MNTSSMRPPIATSLTMIALGVAACSSSTAPHGVSVPPPGHPPVVLALVNGKDVEVVSVTPSASKVLRSARLPSPIVDLQWTGRDPVLLMEHRPIEQCLAPEPAYKTAEEYAAAQRECQFDPAYDGQIGRLTSTGFQPYPALPASTWAALPPPGPNDHPCETGCWRLEVTSTDEVYQGHCIAAFSADGREICDTWRYARIDVPGPALASVPEPAPPAVAPRPDASTPFVVAPSPHVKLAFSHVTPPPQYEGEEPEPRRQLQCELGGRTTSYPALADLDAGMLEELEWIATDPPMFVAYHGHAGLSGYTDTVLFEGCRPRVIRALQRGPDDLVAIDGGIELRRRGELAGRTVGGSLVVFAP